MKTKQKYQWLDAPVGRARAFSLQDSSKHKHASVGLQSIIPPRDYIPPRIAAEHRVAVLDYPGFLYVRHSVFSLIIGLGFLVALAFWSNEEDMQFRYYFTRAMLGVAFVMIWFGAAHFPDTLLNRPHPVFWRIVQACAIVYLLFVGFLFTLELDTARQVLRYVDPRLGIPLEEKNYAMDCRIYTPENPNSKFANLADSVDIFMMSHWFGWWIKMLVLRDSLLCSFLSVLFEGLELTFKHWLPNFAECWWDSIILDLLFCNAIGIIMGHLTCKYLAIYNLDWMGKKGKSVSAFSQFCSVFVPNVWKNYKWELFSSTKNFLVVSWLVTLNNVSDLNHFFLKYELWVPHNHWTLLLRVSMLAFLFMITVKEYHEYANTKNYRRFSSSLWITHSIIILETATSIKFGSKLFPLYFPTPVIISWSIAGIIYVATLVFLIIRDLRRPLSPQTKWFNPYNPPIYIEYSSSTSFSF